MINVITYWDSANISIVFFCLETTIEEVASSFPARPCPLSALYHFRPRFEAFEASQVSPYPQINHVCTISLVCTTFWIQVTLLQTSPFTLCVWHCVAHSRLLYRNNYNNKIEITITIKRKWQRSISSRTVPKFINGCMARYTTYGTAYIFFTGNS